MKRERFVPHDIGYLESIRAFPDGAIPHPVYEKHKAQYAATQDITIERVTYEHEGLAITGLIATPHADPKGVVVYNRGGSGNFGILTLHAVMRQFIPLAREGYLVLGSNYRGNDGGEGKDEFGGRDVDDVIALYEQAAPKSLPVYLIGHSRGCMESYLMLKKGFQARAMVGIAGVADALEWNNDRSEMRKRVYQRYIPDFASREEEALTERSVVYWPEKIACPLLLLHGTADDRVPHHHSEAIARKLERLGKPHKLVLYEGGNHALTRHWDDVTRQTLKWLEAHA